MRIHTVQYSRVVITRITTIAKVCHNYIFNLKDFLRIRKEMVIVMVYVQIRMVNTIRLHTI